ncbi:unnamed protein product [Timema podura]|uniref:Uncharacterized protein n=1 Tax=Timema podura TaxID=61482 RepID=A0ABN7P1R2_TIMPD|nr:unnamed protein product [Timema podura]
MKRRCRSNTPALNQSATEADLTDLSETAISHLPTSGLKELEVLRLQDTDSLKIFPSIYHFEFSMFSGSKHTDCIITMGVWSFKRSKSKVGANISFASTSASTTTFGYSKRFKVKRKL